MATSEGGGGGVCISLVGTGPNFFSHMGFGFFRSGHIYMKHEKCAKTNEKSNFIFGDLVDFDDGRGRGIPLIGNNPAIFHNHIRIFIKNHKKVENCFFISFSISRIFNCNMATFDCNMAIFKEGRGEGEGFCMSVNWDSAK